MSMTCFQYKYGLLNYIVCPYLCFCIKHELTRISEIEVNIYSSYYIYRLNTKLKNGVFWLNAVTFTVCVPVFCSDFEVLINILFAKVNNDPRLFSVKGEDLYFM